MSQFIPIDQITIGPRQRKKIESQPLADLVESIRKFGLLHAPTYLNIANEPGSDPVWKLIVGERRTKAIMKLHEGKTPFLYNGETVPLGMIPAVTLHDSLSRADLKQVEFDENKIREQLPWQDEVEALAEIHRLRQEESGAKKLSFSSTAEVLIEEGVVENKSVDSLATRISRATVIAENLTNPTIAKARNETEAYNLLIKSEEEKINASLARRRIAAHATLPDIVIRQGDALQVLPALDSGIADLILSDPPFGINADTGGFRQRTVHHHNYEDTPEKARAIAQAIILDGFRIAKPMANLMLFCDIDLFYVLREMAGRVGWVPFRTPIIWRKSMSEGMAPWQGKGFRRTYEMLFWATKGQRGLISSPVDVLDESRVSRSERTHAAEKPVGLLQTLIECSTLPGDFVLDPCCGSGSTLVAARNTKRTGMGLEIDPTFYNTAMSNVYKESSESSDSTTSGGGVDLESLA